MSTRSRSRPTSPAADERYDNPLSRSDEEDFKLSQLPPSRGSRRDYDGETDEESLDTDAEDRKLEAELWDEQEVVGAETGKEGKRQWVMNAMGKSGSRSQQYSSVGAGAGSASRSGSRRSNSTRSAGGSSRRSSTRRMNELGTAAEGGAAFAAASPSEKGLRRLSLQSSSSPPPPPAKKSRTRCALWICLALLLIAIVAGIVAGVMIHKNKSNPVGAANSTSAGDNVSLSATGTDAQGNTLYATISGSGASVGASATGASSEQNGQYASSLNSLGMYPGKASEFDNGQYHSSAALGSGSQSAQATATNSQATEAGSSFSSSANDGLYHPYTSSTSAPESSPSATDASQSSATSLSGSQSSSGSASSSSSSTDDSWNVFGWGDYDSSASSGSSASSTTSGASNSASALATGTSIDWSTYGGHGLGDSNSQGSSSSSGSSGMTDGSQQPGGWGAAPTLSPSALATDSAALGHGGPQQMSIMTWGTQVITVAGGGATALSGSQTQSANGGWQTGSPSSSSQDWGAAPSSTTLGWGWASAPSATASSTPASAYSVSNFSMAVQPEIWQQYQGSATWFTADRHFSPCGIAGNDTDYLVALPLSIYTASLKDGSSVESTYCGSKVTVTSLSDGATIDAWVSDACAYCDGESSLDLSQAAFAALSTSEGLAGGSLSVIWGFQADASDANKPFEDSKATTVATSWISGQTIAAQAVQAGW